MHRQALHRTYRCHRINFSAEPRPFQAPVAEQLRTAPEITTYVDTDTTPVPQGSAYLPAPHGLQFEAPRKATTAFINKARSLNDVETDINKSAWASYSEDRPTAMRLSPTSVVSRIDEDTLRYGDGFRRGWYMFSWMFFGLLFLLLPADGWKPFRTWLHSLHKDYDIPGLESLTYFVHTLSRSAGSDPAHRHRNYLARARLFGEVPDIDVQRAVCCFFICLLTFVPRYAVWKGIWRAAGKLNAVSTVSGRRARVCT